MRAFLAAVIAAIEAAAVALVGLLVVAVPVLLLWMITFSLLIEPKTILGAIVGIWQLAHFVPLPFTLSPETALAYGLEAEKFSFVVSLAPLGITALTAVFGARAGWRLGGRGGEGFAGALSGAVGFGAIAALAASLSSQPGAAPTRTVLIPALVFALPSIAGFVTRAAMDEHPWWLATMRGLQRALGYLGLPDLAVLPARILETVRLAAISLVMIVAIVALFVAGALAAGYASELALAQQLHLDLLGVIVLFLGQLALLPVALVWGIDWFSGAGFAVGAGTSTSPFESLLGPLPALPMFGALPHGWGAFGPAAPALLVVGGIAVGVVFARRSSLRYSGWGAAVFVPLLGAALAGLAAAGLTRLGSGSIGPDRLSRVGGDPWLVGGLIAGELAVGLLLGVAASRIDFARLRSAVPTAVPLDIPGRFGRGRRADADDQPTVDLSGDLSGDLVEVDLKEVVAEVMADAGVAAADAETQDLGAGYPGAADERSGKSTDQDPAPLEFLAAEAATEDPAPAEDDLPVEDPEAEAPELEQPEAEQPETEQPEAEQPETEEPASGTPASGTPVTGEPASEEEAEEALRAFSWDAAHWPDADDPGGRETGGRGLR